jgi:hypothetical protein
MKKELLLINLCFILIAFLSLESCKKDETETDAQTIIVGKVWKIKSRTENGGTASLPTCAEDDTLELLANGTYNSLIGGTMCNPSELEVKGGTYTFSADKKTITFNVQGLGYTGKVIEATETQMVIEFNYGHAILRDTFVPK